MREGDATLDPEVFIDDPEGIHLLTLVFVETLDLNIEDRVRINFDAFLVENELGCAFLVVMLDFGEGVENVLVVVILHQTFEICCVALPACAQQ